MKYFQILENYGYRQWMVIASSLSPCDAKKQFSEELRYRRLRNQTFNRLLWIVSDFSGEVFNEGQGVITPRTYSDNDLDSLSKKSKVSFSWD